MKTLKLCDEDPNTINHVRLMAWDNRFKQHKACKIKNKQKLKVCGMLPNRFFWLIKSSLKLVESGSIYSF